jgi:GT2 family glycosyltransferase
MEKVSVVIPVYGQWNLAKRNIDALLKYDVDYISEILIVNDCSPESNPYTFSKIVKVIDNEKNLGYAGTVNNGLRQAQSKLIVLLDSDAFPISAFIDKLIKMYHVDPTIGCIGFGTIDEEGNDTGNYQLEPSILGLIAGQLLESKLDFLRFWRSKNKLPYSCAVSFTKKCLEDLSYFDAETFPVLEADNDISMRVHRSKWKLIFTKEILICHKGGNSYKVDHKRVVLFHESRWRLLKKHGMIPSLFFSKNVLLARLNIELLIFKLLSNKKYADKITGREILIEKFKHY